MDLQLTETQSLLKSSLKDLLSREVTYDRVREMQAKGIADTELWERLHLHFSDEELVELGYFIGVTLGQQSWIRTLDIGHHEVLDISVEGLAPNEVRAAARR